MPQSKAIRNDQGYRQTIDLPAGSRHLDKGASINCNISVQLRVGVLPSVSSNPVYEGAAGIAGIGYGLRIGKP